MLSPSESTFRYPFTEHLGKTHFPRETGKITRFSWENNLKIQFRLFIAVLK